MDQALSELDEDEKLAWDHGLRQSYITHELREEIQFGINDKNQYSFRELTEKLLIAYTDNPQLWQDRIRPGRIWGVINESIEKFNISKVYLYVTDQIPEHHQDTVYLYQILERWFKSRCETQLSNVSFEVEQIGKSFPAVNLEALMNSFYQKMDSLAQSLDPDEVILVSLKGGTPQMATALQIQAIASGIPKLLFMDPKLSIKKILHGEPSDCQITSYWKYQQTHKIQIVRQLFDRWDFDGVAQILKQWKDTLAYLQSIGIEDISPYSDKLDGSVAALELAVAYLNLDNKRARQTISNHRVSLETLVNIGNDYNLRLNLYTQCRINVSLNQHTNLLSRLSSFIEACLHYIIAKIGRQYFESIEDLELNKLKTEESLWNQFYEIESMDNNQFKRWDFKSKPKYKLKNRFTKRNFTHSLIQHRDIDNEKKFWNDLLITIQSFDYWIEIRNQLIHFGSGISLETMKDKLETDKNDKVDYADCACLPNEILNQMANAYNQMTKLLNQQKSLFIGESSEHYLYSEIRSWVLNQLRS
jgi:hypothetical protein